VAQAAPEAAVLAALVHHRGAKALPVARTALRAAARLDDARRVLYTEAIVRMAHEAHRASLEEYMNQLRIPRNYKWLYKPMQDYVEETRREGISEGKAAGKAEGMAEGKAEGMAEGKAEGMAEGEAKGKMDSLLTVLKARGLALSEEQRLRIESCHDLSTLDRWLLAALKANSVEEVFAVH
jgi:flagellar biosynthesis/type III secretory pathway protein FliH